MCFLLRGKKIRPRKLKQYTIAVRIFLYVVAFIRFLPRLWDRYREQYRQKLRKKGKTNHGKKRMH